MDPSGHLIAVSEKVKAAKSAAVTPATGAAVAGLGVLAVPATATPAVSVGVPDDLQRRGNFASDLMAQPFTPVEAIDQGRAGKKHFFVLPSGVNGEVATTDLSVHTVPQDHLDRRQPLLSAAPDAWVTRAPGGQPVIATQLSDWRLPLQSWRDQDFTRAESGLQINLGSADERWVQVAGNSYMSLGVVLLPRKKASLADRKIQVFEYENVGCRACLFMPTLLALDARDQPLGIYRGFFDRYRPGGRFSFPGWRGRLQLPAATQRLLIVDERPLPAGIPRHLPTFSVEYAQ